MKKVIRILVVVLLVGSLAGCALFQGGASRKPKYPTPLDDSMKEAFTLAEQNYFNGNFGEADRLYQLYISSYGYNEYTDEARFKLGEISFMNKKYSKALSFYREAFQDLYNPQIAPKAQFKAALSLYKLKHFDQVLPLLDTMDRRDVSPILGLRTESLAIHVGNKLGSKRDDVIKWYLFLLDDYAVLSPDKYEGKVSESLVTKEEAHAVVVGWVRDANVTLASVDQLPLKYMKKKPSGGYVLYKLAMLNYANGDFDSAKKYMSSFVRGYPKNEFAGSGTALLAELKGKMSGKKFKVGVILPLSGRFSLYGNSTLHGIQCAAGLTPPCTSPYTIELIVKDSAGNAAVAEQAVDALAKEGVVGYCRRRQVVRQDVHNRFMCH